MLMLRRILGAFFALAISVAPASAAAILFNGGTIIGVSGVSVDGTLYDVMFVDGSCIDLFAGCDDTADFTFQTVEDAVEAGEALLPLIQFFDPEDFNGCSSTEGCDLLIPYQPLGSPLPGEQLAYVRIVSGSGDSVSAFVGPNAESDLTNVTGRTYAVWSLPDGDGTGSPVPEPGTFALLATGVLVAMRVRAGRRR